METMASGMPVVTTAHSGIPELVKDRGSGYVVPERNVQMLREKLEYLVDHPKIWLQMGANGHNYVAEHFNINILNKSLDRIIRSFVDNNGE